MCASIGTLLIAATMASCGNGWFRNSNQTASTTMGEISQPKESEVFLTAYVATENIPELTNLWTQDDLDAIAKTLAGECYDDKELDKRRVCEVILNRVSSEDFPDTILEVLSYPNAFYGYKAQFRETTENDYAVAARTLMDWYGNSCQPLSNYLFFEAGENRENIFREEY